MKTINYLLLGLSALLMAGCGQSTPEPEATTTSGLDSAAVVVEESRPVPYATVNEARLLAADAEPGT